MDKRLSRSDRAFAQRASNDERQAAQLPGNACLNQNSAGAMICLCPGDLSVFWAHFAQSALRDDQGRPLLFFHGARPTQGHQAIESFALPSLHDGIYFTPDPQYAGAFTCPLFDDALGHGAIYPAYLNIQNPYVVTAEYESQDWSDFVNRGLSRARLEASGFDGAVLKEPDGTIDQVIVFSSAQIISSLSPISSLMPQTKPDLHQARALEQYLYGANDKQRLESKRERQRC